jgi:hypothetical protein
MKSAGGVKAGKFHCLSCGLQGVLPDCLSYEGGTCVIECPRCNSEDVDCYSYSAELVGFEESVT